MYELKQDRPLAGEVVVEQVWMPVKHAARAAGVPERSAFRWAKKGAVPVRRSGKVQLVEVAALQAFAARPMNAGVAAGGATAVTAAGVAVGGSPGISSGAAAKAATVAEVSALADWDERLCGLEEVLQELFERVAALEGGGAAGR